MLRRVVSLVLFAVLLIAAPHVRAQTGGATRAVARLGADVSPEARRYFGLFPDVNGAASVGIAAAGDALRLTLRRTGAPDSLVTLTPNLADALGAVVDAYEAFFWDERDEGRVTPALSGALIRLREARVLVPSTLKREVAFVYTLSLTDGSVVRGRVLAATDAAVALWTAGGAYRWDRADTGVRVVPLAAIARTDLLGSSLVPVAVSGALHALALSAAALSPGEARAGTAAGAGALATAYRLYRAGTQPTPGARFAAFSRVAFFRQGTPPEFDDAVARATPAALAAPYPRPRVTLAQRWLRTGPFVSATFGRIDEDPLAAAFTTRSSGTGNFPVPVRPVEATGRLFAERATSRAEAEVHVPLPVLPIGFVGGATATQFEDAPERFRAVVGGQTQDVTPEYEESITGRTQSSLYGGLSIGRVGGPTLGNRLIVAYGVRRDAGVVSGAFYSTLALQQGPPDEPQATLRYRDEVSATRPFVRVTYEVMLTRVTSAFATGDWGREAVFAQPERRVTTTFPDFGYTFTATRAAHETRIGGRTVTGGLRLHL